MLQYINAGDKENSGHTGDTVNTVITGYKGDKEDTGHTGDTGCTGYSEDNKDTGDK